MNVRLLSEKELIDPATEMHYRLQHISGPWLYRHCHDFFELAMPTDSTLDIEVNGKNYELPAGGIILIRPGEIHSRACRGNCECINLGFPAKIIDDMSEYLRDDSIRNMIYESEFPPMAKLSGLKKEEMEKDLKTLTLLPIDMPQLVRLRMRKLILHIVVDYISPSLSGEKSEDLPVWMTELMRKAESPEVFSGGLNTLAALAGRSREHVCRSFKKYLGKTPTEYLNIKKINFAANLLVYTDRKIIDVAFDSGFQSLSRFYQEFKTQFRCSPGTYRSFRRREKN